MGKHLIAAGALQLFLLEIETFDESFDLPLVSFQFIEKFSGSFVREKTVQVIPLPWEEGVEVHFPSLIFFAWGSGFLLIF